MSGLKGSFMSVLLLYLCAYGGGSCLGEDEWNREICSLFIFPIVEIVTFEMLLMASTAVGAGSRGAQACLPLEDVR